MEETSQENVPVADGDEVDSSADSSADSNAEGNADTPAGAGSTLWEQMMAREGREAARPSGMRAGDWQAERQLQEALRESRQEVEASDAPGGRQDNEENFIDAGFRALGTNAVEGEEEDEPFSDERRSNAIHSSDSGGGGSSAGGSGVSASAGAGAGKVVETTGVNTATNPAQRKPAQTGEAGGETGEEQNELDVEEDEDFGDVELIVTQDGGVIPVTSAVVEESEDAAVAAAAAVSVGKRGGQWKTRERAANHGPASRAVKGKAAAAGAAGGAPGVTVKDKLASTSGSEQRVGIARRGAVRGGGVAA